MLKIKLNKFSSILQNNKSKIFYSTRKERLEKLLSPLKPLQLIVTDYGTEGESNSIDIRIVSEEFKNIVLNNENYDDMIEYIKLAKIKKTSF